MTDQSDILIPGPIIDPDEAPSAGTAAPLPDSAPTEEPTPMPDPEQETEPVIYFSEPAPDEEPAPANSPDTESPVTGGSVAGKNQAGKNQAGENQADAPLAPENPAPQSEILERLEAIEALIAKKNSSDVRMIELFDKMYDEMATYKKDLYAKLLLPFVNETISLIDDYNRVLARITDDTPADKILSYLKNITGDLEDLLDNNGVELYTEEGDNYNPRTQRSVGTVPTTDPEKNGLVAERVRKGYWWQGKILKPESVKLFKL